MIYTMSEVIANSECKKSAFAKRLGVSGQKGANYELTGLTKDMINKQFLDENILRAAVEDKYIFNKQKEREVQEIAFKIKRYLSWINSNHIRVYPDSKGFGGMVKFGDKEFYAVADTVLFNKMTNTIIVGKIKNSKPKMSYYSRNPENEPKNSMDLFILQLLIEQKVVQKFGFQWNYIPAIIHLGSRKDGKKLANEFEAKEGDNIIYGPHPEYYTEELKGRLREALVMPSTLGEANAKENDNCKYCEYNAVCRNIERVEPELFIEEIDDEKKEYPLTDEQEQAVFFDKGFARVNAGAGSGKTTIIINRIGELIDNGVDIKDILLITFTNKGAEEMRDRLRKMYSDDVVENAEIMTFNSFGDRFVMDNYKELGFKKKPKLIQDLDKYKIVIRLLDNIPNIDGLDYKNTMMNYRYAKGSIVRTIEFFDLFERENMKSVNEFHEKYPDYSFYLNAEKEAALRGVDVASELFDLYLKYKEVLIEETYINYNDQINCLLEAIENNPEILRNYSYKHILVDEFQDTDKNQLRVLEFLSKDDRFESLMVVGDDAQSIFGFRGTTPEIMINFKNYFPETVDINITRNFRSTKEIVDLANAINNNNHSKIDKELVSDVEGIKPVLFINDQVDLIINHDIIDVDDNNYKKIAFIARTNKELQEIHEALSVKGIPSTIDVARPLIYNDSVLLFKQMVNYINNPQYDIGLFNFLSLYNTQFAKLNIEDARDYMNDKKNELSKSWFLNYSPIDEFGNVIDTNIVKFRFLESIVEEINDEELTQFFKELLEEFDNVKSLNGYMNDLYRFNDRRVVDIDRAKHNSITLTTAHSSKGREFDIVYFVINKFVVRSEEIKDWDEERRLLFTGATRAKKELYLIGLGSSFMSELDEMKEQGLLDVVSLEKNI